MRLLATALALAAAPALAQQAPAPALEPGLTLLSLTAEGQSRRAPDLALFSSGVVTQGKTAGEAIAANARAMDSVIAALKRAGVADRDIQTASLSLQPRYSNPELEAQLLARERREPYIPPINPPAARIIGYEAQNTVSVRVRRLGEMGKVIDALVAAGANQINGPSFTVDEPAAALNEARSEAIAAGRKRAELYARAAGLRVQRIVSISEGGGYYPVQDIMVMGRALGSAAAPPPPPTPVAPGELTLGVSVSMQFALAR